MNSKAGVLSPPSCNYHPSSPDSLRREDNLAGLWLQPIGKSPVIHTEEGEQVALWPEMLSQPCLLLCRGHFYLSLAVDTLQDAT